MVVVVHKNFKDKETRTKKTYLHLSLGPFFSVLYPCEPAIGGDPLLTMVIVEKKDEKKDLPFFLSYIPVVRYRTPEIPCLQRWSWVLRW
jgi:hypothetical protein